MISFKGVDFDKLDLNAEHVDVIDMGDGTHERIQLPICFWWMLEQIITVRGRPMSAILEEINSWNYQGHATFEAALFHYLKWYAQGMVESGEIPLPPYAPNAGEGKDTVHRE